MTTSTSIAVPAAGTYELDPQRTTIAFTTKHMFGMGTVTGTFGDVRGSLVVADGGHGSSVDVTAAAASFDSHDKRRDAKVTSKAFLHADAHPQLRFVSDGVQVDDDGWHLDGTLTVRGGSAPLRLTVTGVVPGPDGVTIEAQGSVDRYAHGITAMKGMAARMLSIRVTAHAVRC